MASRTGHVKITKNLYFINKVFPPVAVLQPKKKKKEERKVEKRLKAIY